MAGQKKKHADLALLDTLPKEQIQVLFEAGVSETRICYKLGIGKKALTEWLDRPENEGFLSRVRAKAADNLVSEIIEISDDDEEEVKQAMIEEESNKIDDEEMEEGEIEEFYDEN